MLFSWLYLVWREDGEGGEKLDGLLHIFTCSCFFPYVRVFCALQRTLELKYKKCKDRVREPCLKPDLVEIKRERKYGYRFVYK